MLIYKVKVVYVCINIACTTKYFIHCQYSEVAMLIVK